RRRSRALSAALAALRDPVVERGAAEEHDEAGEEAVEEADQAAQERHAIADEELAEEREVRSHRPAPLDHEPEGGQAQAGPSEQARHQTGGHRADAAHPDAEDGVRIGRSTHRRVAYSSSRARPRRSRCRRARARKRTLTRLRMRANAHPPTK